ncbi:MAG TPA: DNA polymerase III subunit gamma/tau, partial [Cyanobacteria bacterium UBA11149]|nr:DNA polymerase III subunit gamma/tau [Cyanobacteria bacterium UBA11149]
LAKSLNCQKSNKPTEFPCGVCEVCKGIASASGAALDVIEIDAASNTGVDNIRDLIEKAQFAPVQCRYKVYAIDECHMLSVAAFNALLKTLEEPPKHVVFILATTDPQRVLPTIISRCQKFDFRRIPLESMVQHLRDISVQEKIDITNDALTLIAQVAQGGLRDAQSLLDQLSLLPEKVTVEGVWDLVGSVPEQDLLALVSAIKEDHSEKVLDLCRNLMDRGREPLIVLQNMASFYRDLLIAKTAPNRQELVPVTSQTWDKMCEFVKGIEISTILQSQQHLKNSEVQVKNTTQPRLWLEVTLLGLLPSANTFRSGNITTQARGQKSDIPRQELPKTPQSEIPPVNLNNFHDNPTHFGNGRNPGLNGNGTKPPMTPPANRIEENKPHEKPYSDPITPVTYNSYSSQESDNLQTNLQEIWQNLLNNLPPAPRSLLKEHGELLSFQDSVAKIAIRNETLLKSAQKNLAKIEATFAAIFQSHIKVILETKLSKSSNTTATQKPTSQNPPPPSISETKPTSSPQTDNELKSPNISELASKREEALSKPGEEEQTNLNFSEDKLNPKHEIINDLRDGEQLAEKTVGNPANVPETLFINSEVKADPDLVEKARNTIKQIFEGELIDLTDNTALSSSTMNNQLPSNQTTDEENQEIEEQPVNLEEMEEANNRGSDIIQNYPPHRDEELSDLANFSDDDDIPF